MRDCESGGPLDGDNDCGDILEDGYVDLYDSARECCQNKMGWQDLEQCLAATGGASGAPGVGGTGEWYVNWEEEK